MNGSVAIDDEDASGRTQMENLAEVPVATPVDQEDRNGVVLGGSTQTGSCVFVNLLERRNGVARVLNRIGFENVEDDFESAEGIGVGG